MNYSDMSKEELIAVITRLDQHIKELESFREHVSNERTLRYRKQAKGIEDAKASGTKFGRPPKEIPAEFKACRDLYIKGYITLKDAAREMGVSVSTINKWMKNSID